MAAWTRMALWKRYVLTLALAAALTVVLVRYVDAHNTDSPRVQNFAGEVRANEEAAVLVSQDQAPHVVALPGAASPRAAITRAVRRDLASRIASGSIEGPLRRATCRPAGAHDAFSCLLIAAGVQYPYLGVVDRRARRITYCKRDPPPVPQDDVPVSPRCTR